MTSGLTMQRMLLVPLLAAAVAGAAKGQESGGKADGALAQKILKLEDERNHGVRNADIALLDRVYTDNLVYVTGFGEVLSKTEHLDRLRSGKTKMTLLRHDDTVVHIYSKDLATVTARSTSVVSHDGEVYSRPRRFTDVWVRQNGQWRFAVHHETFVAQP